MYDGEIDERTEVRLDVHRVEPGSERSDEHFVLIGNFLCLYLRGLPSDCLKATFRATDPSGVKAGASMRVLSLS